MWLVASGLMAAGLAGIWLTMDGVNPLLFFGVASVLGGLVLSLSLARKPVVDMRRRPGAECECRYHLRDVIHAHWNGAHRKGDGIDHRIVLADHLMGMAVEWQYGRDALGMRHRMDEAVMIGRGISKDFGERVVTCVMQQDLEAADGMAVHLMTDFLSGRSQLQLAD